MRQITIRQLVRQGNKANIVAWLPFEIVSDGEVIATVQHLSDSEADNLVGAVQTVRQASERKPDVRQFSPYSREAQIGKR